MRPIPSAQMYLASKSGRIYEGWMTGKFRFAVSTFENGGYLRCSLDGRKFLVHRLIAEAFIGPCPNGKQINHKNCDRTDNRPKNLEYVTPLQNIRHGIRFRRRQQKELAQLVGKP